MRGSAETDGQVGSQMPCDQLDSQTCQSALNCQELWEQMCSTDGERIVYLSLLSLPLEKP